MAVDDTGRGQPRPPRIPALRLVEVDYNSAMRRRYASWTQPSRGRFIVALKRRLPVLMAVAMLAQLSACTLLPPRFDDRAADAGLTAATFEAGGFVLRTYRSRPARPGERLHIYLDGDGRPWRADPTTARRVVLDLIEQDPAPVILIGRPCYYGMVEQ
ncbi:MAG: hypothetical protein KJO38_05585, partial [Gammaproteobacteria bacterium]|nr:hypothetical protein [Gammaproteobacteria bacterium]